MNTQFFGEVKNHLNDDKNILLTGLTGSSKSFFINEVYKNKRGKMLCIVPNEEKAYDLEKELKALVGKNKVFLFLTREFAFIKENLSKIETQRILTLRELLFHPKRSGYIITTPGALLYKMLSPNQIKEKTIEIEIDNDINIDNLLKKWVEAGYTRNETVRSPGEFAVRGGIIDVFPVGEEHPYRIELFGDTVDSIHKFDPDTQRSEKKEKRVIITPADELQGEKLESTLMDHFSKDITIFFDEPREFFKTYDRETRRYNEFKKEAEKEEKDIKKLYLTNRNELSEIINKKTVIYHSFFPGNIPQVKVAMLENISQKEMEPFYNNYETLILRLKEWLQKNYTVKVALKSKPFKKQLQEQFIDNHLSGVELIDLNLEKGFVSQTFKYALITEQDIRGKKAGKKPSTKKKEAKIILEDLKIGDYVVHETYGIGIYRGVTQANVDNVIKEYLLLQYAGTDKLYLPVDKLDLLYKYTISEEKQPRLNKLGGTEWEKTRKKVSKSIQELAEELLRLYAMRENVQGYAFAPDTPWQMQFEDEFPYQETPDQLKSIKEVKQDMERQRPMDRLICGDVGYGKTEVALRAAFKAVMDGKQVALLVPTTVLAEQHYESFKQRFANYPAIVEVLSRFRTPKEQKKVIEDLNKGAVDIVIGTHRMLSKDIKFKELGLLIIDEEHRFGVAQKEKIKALKELVDVLSLSATPIPRSLHMSLTGLRDLSVIETPPPERYPITTYVLEYNEEIIREAVLAEIDRGGQVFFVHNRIQDIYKVKEELEKVLPGLNIAVGHGRMKEEELSKVLLDFNKGAYHILLCTTIIESGLDMPNVNTIIIDGADRMGLAQLYQLRGRVGRSNRLAYAYLTYRPEKVITEAAQKRLNAIREFNELGAGMKLALRDLEIRGAGNILGPEQHGYIQAVGFDLYVRLLEEETQKLKGEKPKEVTNPQLDIDVDYYIPDSYIPDSGTKIRIYRRLLLATEQEEVEEIRKEILDRFGNLPQPVENFLQIALLRIQAKNKEIKGIKRKGKQMEITLNRPLNKDVVQHLKEVRMKTPNEYTIQLKLDSSKSITELQTLLGKL
ncbi:Transcription-repair coupling factor [Candidatus Syntrophocurvum alkaliphilum]|uniref:Transcription-repair-coupling factor n=1 Tax=Candidatus Syntrophocurvum alkaliphilum TaxID=2293317 RepID=A0A6I6DKU4_9FIRM|nr:transcription-repair coupling factor [Candidatus Syntrophocurvum alkaliphilum]QGU00537.1 Transcription-repair coupling factor [Candidatus Syntrophocurvum alkaliphilum]